MTGSARKLGHRILGRRFDYLLHLRPAEWPIMAGHTVVGYLLAVGVSGAFHGAHLGVAFAGVFIWVVLLNGGTLAINSAFDRDEGDIGYLKSPPPVPAHLAGFALTLLVAGQAAAALWLPAGYTWAYAACFAMSLVYSVPPIRLKAVPGIDWLINMWGFGTLTPYAGYAATGLPLDLPRGIVLLAFCPLFACLYPLTQLYQFDEDRRRGDRTLALMLGMRRSLILSCAAAAVAFLLLGLGGRLAGWGWGLSGVVRWGGLGLAAVAWGRVLCSWLARHPAMTPRQHQAGMYAALGAWALTDAVVILGWGVYS